MHMRSTNFGVVQGFAYGSNAAWSQSVPMASLVGASLPSGEFFQNDGYNTTHYSGSAFGSSLASGSLCNAKCLSFESGSRNCNPDPVNHPENNNIAPERYRYADISTSLLRKNVENLYAECLNNGNVNGATDTLRPCYLNNMHARDLLQIIDDAGNFKGWVGVEASLYTLYTNKGGAAYIGAFHQDAA